MEGHEQGEAKQKPALMGLLGDQQGTCTRQGAQLSPWALESRARSGHRECSLSHTVRSGGVQIQRKSCAARVQVARGRTWRRRRLSQSGPCPALSWGRGPMQTSRMGFWGCLCTTDTQATADVCPLFFFFFWWKGEKERAVSLLVGRMQPVQVQCLLTETFLQENTCYKMASHCPGV